MLVIHINGHHTNSEVYELPSRVKQTQGVPVLALVTREALSRLDYGWGIDDFAVEPWDLDELITRVRGLLWKAAGVRTDQLVQRGGLIIDQSRCEVSVGGRVLDLTFREYELLRFLAINEGKVFSRSTLLDKVWGFDYLGGDRTVDVHIRRLRHKMEDSKHTFFETVRNVGYRFVRQSEGPASLFPAKKVNSPEILPK